MGDEPRRLVFIGLNPSTADENKDDPTIRRCIGFAKRFGFDGVVMLNLFAFRATLPEVMKAAPNPVGPHNDAVIKSYLGNTFIAAWGVHGSFLGRDREVSAMIPELFCLGTTKEGHPRHPLYLKNDAELKLWRPLT